MSKIEAALQEVEETAYWIELLVDGRIVPTERLQNLLSEAQELIAVFVQSAKTAKGSKGVFLY